MTFSKARDYLKCYNVKHKTGYSLFPDETFNALVLLNRKYDSKKDDYSTKVTLIHTAELDDMGLVDLNQRMNQLNKRLRKRTK